LVVEHYVLSDTLFMALLVAGTVLLLWRDRPGPWLAALSGVTLAAAGLTRVVGLGLLPIVLLYAAVRHVGWRALLALVLGVAVPLSGYVVWFHHVHGVYDVDQWSGRFLWSRTTTFVDCSRADFTADERAICPPRPVAERPVPDVYLWSYDQDQLASRFPGTAHDALFGGFARKAILGQPAAFVLTVGRDTVHFVQPGWPLPERLACVNGRWRLPSGPGLCPPELVVDRFTTPAGAGPAGAIVTPLNAALKRYGDTLTVPPLGLFVIAVFVLVAVAVRRGWRCLDGRDALFLATLGVSVIVLSVATSGIDWRYGVPSVALVPMAGAFAVQLLRPVPGPGRETAGAPTSPGRPDR
jgi:hypothetical protein